MQTFNPLFDALLKSKPLCWRSILENARNLVGLLNRIQLVLFNGVCKERCVAVYLLGKRMRSLGRRSGYLFLSLYLKQCSQCLMTYRGSNTPIDRGNLSVPVRLSRSGLPIIIPSFHRVKIIKGGDEGDALIQFYLSCFTINKIIPLASRITKKTFDSMVMPVSNVDDMFSVVHEMAAALPSLLETYTPWIKLIPLRQGLKFKPMFSTLPSVKVTQASLYYRSGVEEKKALTIRSPFLSFIYELANFMDLCCFAREERLNKMQGLCWPHFIRFPLDQDGNDFISEVSDQHFNDKIFPYLPDTGTLGAPPSYGRLGMALPGAGKRRIFAMGNYINQRLLAPLHDFMSEVLKRLPMDGMFDQTRPLSYLKDIRTLFSFDLSAATDRWPLLLIFGVVQHLFGTSYASASVNGCLATNVFQVPFVRNNRTHNTPSQICFVAGQPLGYLGSWPLFAFSHHVVIWLAARRVYGEVRFTKYAVLGDDVLIADASVAHEYKSIIEQLGVKISIAKSLISDNGSLEFAKRFIVNCGHRDLSQVSVRNLSNYYHPNGLTAIHLRYNLNSFAVYCRMAGCGYKTLGSLDSNTSLTMQRRRVSWSRFHLPTELWLGGGSPLNPYLRGLLIWKLRDILKPKDLKLPPVEYFPKAEVPEFLEYSLYRSWLESWLRMLCWYAKSWSNPDITIDELLKGAPVVSTSWNTSSFDDKTEVIRWGYYWKCYDFCRKSYSVGILDTSTMLLPKGYLIGSSTTHPFLVSLDGVAQPSSDDNRRLKLWPLPDDK